MSAAMRASRRTVLRGMLGGTAVSVGLPFLDCFLNTNGTALAETGAALPVVFGTYFWGCGLNPGRWEPKTVGKMAELPVELKPLDAFKDRLNVFSGFKVFLDGKPARPHGVGQFAIQAGEAPRDSVTLPTIDSLIADALGDRTRFRSLEVSGSGKVTDSVSRRSAGVVNAAEINPVALYSRVFGAEFKDPNTADFTPDPRVMVRRSVLSGVTEQRAALIKRVGASDRGRLDEYFTSLRRLEQQLDIELQKPAPLKACSVASRPAEGEIGTEIDTAAHNVALFADILAHAIACDQTHVFNVAFEATSSLRRAGTAMTHHILTHEEPVDEKLGYQREASYFNGRIMEMLASILTTFESVREGDGTLLDRTLVLAHSETGFAKIHSLDNIAMMTVGSGGGRIKTGIHVSAKGDPVSRLGLTIQQALGVSVGSWGTDLLKTSKSISEIMV